MVGCSVYVLLPTHGIRSTHQEYCTVCRRQAPIHSTPGHTASLHSQVSAGLPCATSSLLNVLLMLWPMVADGHQSQTGTTRPSAALHWRTQQQTAPCSSPLLTPGHSEMHIFTQLTLSPQLIGNRASENSSYMAAGLIQGKYDGQNTQPLLQRSRFTRNQRDPGFFPTQMRLSVPRWGNDVTLKQLMKSLQLMHSAQRRLPGNYLQPQ